VEAISLRFLVILTCAKCGAQEKYGILQKEIASKVKKRVEADLKKC